MTPTAQDATRELVSPLRAPLAFRVGVVGHRPDRLVHVDTAQLAKTLHEILAVVQDVVLQVKGENVDYFDDHPAVLRAVSPLAEGTDRFFAEQALTLGYELCCPMPFVQEEYERDFALGAALEPASLERFRALIAQTKTCFELDGQRTHSGSAYGAAGRVVLNQSDLLVVVWDGQRKDKLGGTEQTMDEARRQGVPVVLVDAKTNLAWRLLDGTWTQGDCGGTKSQDDPRIALRHSVRQALELPQLIDKGGSHDAIVGKIMRPSRDGLMRFYGEKQPAYNFWGSFWLPFRNFVGDGRWGPFKWSVEPFEQALKDDWPRDKSSAIKATVNRLRPFYAWPDKLAVYYSNRYRSAFILSFLLAALAVFWALLPVAVGVPSANPGTLSKHIENFAATGEMVFISLILIVIFWGRERHWHGRWIDYRLMSELVRHLRLVATLGGERPFPQVPAHIAVYGQPNSSWMAWYVRTVERQLGFPGAVLSSAYLHEAISELEDLVIGQTKFHKSSAGRSERIEHRLHVAGLVLLVGTLVCCAMHLLHVELWLPGLWTFLGGALPALGAALAGISNQGEFRRIAKRSEAMAAHLERLKTELDQLHSRLNESNVEQLSQPVARLASEIARLMINEVLDWRVMLLDRPLQPPG